MTRNSSEVPVRSRAEHWLLAASLILIAFNLRPALASLPVLLPEIGASTGLTALGASYLTAIPVLCLGLFAPLAPRLSQRFGIEKTLLGVMLLLTLCTALRGSGSLPMLFVASALAAGAISVGNVLLPGLVKRDFAAQAGAMTGLYTMAVCGGAAGAAGLSVPLAQWFDHRWTWALAAWAVPAGLVALIWAPQARRRTAAAGRHTGHRVRGLWRDPLAWQVTMYMGLQSGLAYAMFGWLAPILRERGVDGATAGWVISASVMAQVVSCLLLPSFAIRQRNQSWLNVALALLAGACLLAMLYAPLSLVWGYAALLGLAQGGLFSVCMTLIVLRSPDSQVAAHLSSMAQSVGYLIASTGPMAVGLLHGHTGSFASAGYVYGGLALAAAWFGWGAGRAALVKTTSEAV